MKVFNIGGVTMTSQIIKSSRKFNIASEKIINYRVNSLSNHCCQIRILTGERLRIWHIICCFLFLRQEHVHVKNFYINIVVKIFQVAISISIFSTIRPSLPLQRKQTKSNYISLQYLRHKPHHLFLSTKPTLMELITNLRCSFLVVFFGCLHNSIPIVLNAILYHSENFFYLLILQTTPSTNFQQSTFAGLHVK